MNETLFSQIQRLFERTYAQVGINLEDCLIDQRRCRQLTKLAGAAAAELSELARTFLRTADDQLYVGIYYSRWLIAQLEQHDPRAGLTNKNIRSLIMFVEEINHALHAALQFRSGQRRIETESFARDLELQARVDTYLVLLLFVAFFRKTQRVSRADRRWLRFHLFESQTPGAFQDNNPPRALPRNDGTGRELHAFSRHDQRAAPARRDSTISLARLRSEKNQDPRADRFAAAE